MAAAAIPFPLALPNCSDSCGDVEIPYPFGLTEGCYLNGTGDFFINCINNSAGQPQPWTGNVVVTNISIQGQIDIMMYNAFDCYDKSGTPLENNTKPRLRLAPDVDECNGRNNCTNKEVCVNDPGSYHCRCITGYHRDGDGGACVPDQPAGPPSDQRTGQPSLAINLAIEEIEHLLGETSDSSKYDVRNKSTNAYDSVRDHVVLDFDDGR
ncbi:wall-associated receptor kinase 2-like [Fagus crenata]